MSIQLPGDENDLPLTKFELHDIPGPDFEIILHYQKYRDEMYDRLLEMSRDLYAGIIPGVGTWGPCGPSDADHEDV